MTASIAIVGEFKPDHDTHAALNRVLDNFRAVHDFDYEWLPTEQVAAEKEKLLKRFSGIWSPPASPFNSLDGCLAAITWARENGIPHLGTCAGFQHAMIEIARNMLGVAGAAHEEYDPDADTLFVNRLKCSLAGKTMQVHLAEGSLSRALYGRASSEEHYYCNFAVNPDLCHLLDHPGIRISGRDQDGEYRIIELKDHPFFVTTLFVPQTRSTQASPHPLIRGFVETVCGIRQ